LTLASALALWSRDRLPKISAPVRHELQAEAGRSMAKGKLARDRGEAFLDALFAEHGTCQSHEPSRTHARRAQEEPSWEAL
jgi:hypothetical protein